MTAINAMLQLACKLQCSSNVCVILTLMMSSLASSVVIWQCSMHRAQHDTSQSATTMMTYYKRYYNYKTQGYTMQLLL
jgi:hypothetical protein